MERPVVKSELPQLLSFTSNILYIRSLILYLLLIQLLSSFAANCLKESFITVHVLGPGQKIKKIF